MLYFTAVKWTILQAGEIFISKIQTPQASMLLEEILLIFAMPLNSPRLWVAMEKESGFDSWNRQKSLRVQVNEFWKPRHGRLFIAPSSDLWSKECISNESVLLYLNIEMQQ